MVDRSTARGRKATRALLAALRWSATELAAAREVSCAAVSHARLHGVRFTRALESEYRRLLAEERQLRERVSLEDAYAWADQVLGIDAPHADTPARVLERAHQEETPWPNPPSS